MIYLTLEQVLEIHHTSIILFGGLEGVRDKSLLESCITSPRMSIFQQELYPTPFDKGACYLFSIIQNHPFVDGNKRTATATFLTFFKINGIELSFNKNELENFVVDIANHTIKREDISKRIQGLCLVQ